MTEEEKKAIEYLEENIEFFKTTLKRWDCNEDIKQLETILNLIEKQQKEIEEKTTIIMAGAEKVKTLEKEIEELNKQTDNIIRANHRAYTKIDNLKKELNESIPKSKIEDVKQYLEYYLIGNSRFENSQDEFKKILEMLESEE